MSTRPATAADVAFLADVTLEATRDQGRLPEGFDEAAWRAGFEEWTREQVRGQVEHSTTYVVEVDGEPVGRLRVVRAPGEVELAGLQLRPAHQGRGIGTSLVEELAGEARALGVPFRLSVERDNPRARSLYERLGFAAVGGDDDEVLMQRD